MKNIDTDIIASSEDTFEMLDKMLKKWDEKWWNDFYKDKEKPIPFFTHKADEVLASLLEMDHRKKGKSLDVGCGNGRNAIFMAKNGYESKGIDIADEAIEWANKNAEKEKSNVRFTMASFFDFESPSRSYVHIHDSGCLHHIKPHRRADYLSKVHDLLQDDGYFTLVCFNLDGGTNITDYEVYEEKSMQGGLGFSKIKLEKVLSPYFEVLQMRTMRTDLEDYFGTPLCWSVLMKKKVK